MGFPPQQPALSVGKGPVLTTTLSFLSSRAKPRDLRFRGLFLDMFFDIYGFLSCSSLGIVPPKPCEVFPLCSLDPWHWRTAGKLC
jgi:hypothetical protein